MNVSAREQSYSPTDNRGAGHSADPSPEGGPHLALIAGHPGGIGGMEKFCRFLVDTAAAAGWRVTIALSGENIYEHVAADAKHRLAIEQTDWLDRTFAGDRRYHPGTILDRWRWFRRVRPDMALFVQSSNTPLRASIVGAYLAGVPVVATHRTMPWVNEFVPRGRHFFGLVPGIGLHNRRQVRKTWLTAALARCIVYNSHEVRRGYESLYRYPRRKGMVIVNAVDVPAAATVAAMNCRGPCESRPGCSDPESEVTVGYVGRVAPEKRIDVLIRAVAALHTTRRVKLVIYGDGMQQSSLASLAGELGIADRVEWCGTTEDVWKAYDRLDVVVLCSPRESSSNMVLEAMAAGKAVVVTPAGGLPELIGNGRYGICVPPDDVPALAAALARLIENDDERLRIGAAAQRFVRAEHDPRAVGQAWLELLVNVASGRSPRCTSRENGRRGWDHPCPVELIGATEGVPT